MSQRRSRSYRRIRWNLKPPFTRAPETSHLSDLLRLIASIERLTTLFPFYDRAVRLVGPHRVQ